jgi:hypothetical protein
MITVAAAAARIAAWRAPSLITVTGLAVGPEQRSAAPAAHRKGAVIRGEGWEHSIGYWPRSWERSHS